MNFISISYCLGQLLFNFQNVSIFMYISDDEYVKNKTFIIIEVLFKFCSQN